MAKQRKCIFCGKTYEYCPHCNDYNKYPGWMDKFDSEECRDIYNAMCGYSIRTFTSEQVKEVLDKYNIKDYSKFSEVIRKRLNEILPTNKTTVNEDVETKSVSESKPITEERYNFNKKKNTNKQFNFNKKSNIEE